MRLLFARIFAGCIFAVASSAALQAQDATFPYVDIKATSNSIDPVSMGQNISLNGCSSKIHAAQGTVNYGLCESDMDLSTVTLTWAAKLVSPANANQNFVSDWNDGSWTTITQLTGSAVAGGLSNLAVSTGVGSAFTTAGTYIIGLWLKMENSLFENTDPNNPLYEYRNGNKVYLPTDQYGNQRTSQIHLPWRSNHPNSSYKEYTSGLCINPHPGSHCEQVIRFAANDGDLRTDGSSNYSYAQQSFILTGTSVPEPAAALLLIPGIILIARRERRRKAGLNAKAA